MNNRAIAVGVLSLLLVLPGLGCGPASEPSTNASESEPVAAPLDTDAIADLLAARMALQPGERVLLVAAPGRFDGLIAAIRARVVAAGAIDLGVASIIEASHEDWRTDFTRSLAGLEREALVERLSSVDLGVMMPGPQPTHAVYAALQEVLRRGSGRTIHFHWEGAYGLDGEVMMPTAAIDAFYQRSLLETDYAALTAIQQRFAEALRGGTVRVTTPAGTDLSFRVGDRPVTRQDGDASAARATAARNLIDREVELPAGAIRVAPLEETVQGTIAFPPTVWLDRQVDGLVLTLVDGTVAEMNAATGLDAVEQVMAEWGPVARSFRELAVGFNPTLAIPETDPWIPYYGYGDAVVRLSLGDNSELGGRVTGGYVRWNFFTDATVMIDDVVWVRDGRLVIDTE